MGRTKIAIRGQISEYTPDPAFEMGLADPIPHVRHDGAVNTTGRS